MALFTAFFLTALFGIAHPFSRRLEGVERWLLRTLLPDGTTPAAVTRLRGFMARGGWSILASGELWLLLLLAWAITVFERPALAFALLPLGFALRGIADRWFPYPKTLGWYLGHFEKRVRREGERAATSDDAARADEARALLGEIEALRRESGALRVSNAP
jgi:hypothetical protein